MRPQSEITAPAAHDAPAEKKQHTERFMTRLILIQLLHTSFQRIRVKVKGHI